jgi:hypothetical protein
MKSAFLEFLAGLTGYVHAVAVYGLTTDGVDIVGQLGHPTSFQIEHRQADPFFLNDFRVTA